MGDYSEIRTNDLEGDFCSLTLEFDVFYLEFALEFELIKLCFFRIDFV